ncbi:MAG: hypothetical protein O2913_14165 [Chloroflexi bacterium]|nr:hypothetical protein [Chloroflexota bacterium]
MNAVQIVETLLDLGVSLGSDGSKLLLEPGSRVPPELVPDIHRYKLEILQRLPSPTIACEEPTATLLAWAAEAAETDLTLLEPVQFLETPMRPYTTTEVGLYCRQQLKYLSLARSNKTTGGWGRFTPEWWTEMEVNSLEALTAIKASVDERDSHGEAQ